MDTRAAATGNLAFIDGLRAVAVIGIIGFDANATGLSGGFTGVDVFFVLTGFLLSRSIESRLQAGRFSLLAFYERRARAILPTLVVACLLCALAAALMFVPRDLRQFCSTLWASAFFYSNVLFEDLTGYFNAPPATIPLLHTWAVAVMGQFCLLFPPLLVALYRVLISSARARLAVVFLAFLASLCGSILLVKFDPARAFYLLWPPRAWELLAGTMIVLAPWPPVISRMAAESLTAFGCACIGLSFFWYSPSTLFPGAAALLPCAGVAAILVGNLKNATVIGALLSQRHVAYLGQISYGLYLYHWPVLTFSRYFLDRELSPLQSVSAMSASAALAVLSYHLIEAPIRRASRFKSRASLFAAALLGVVAVGVLGIIGVNLHGLPSRFSGAALTFAQGEDDSLPWGQCMPELAQLNADSVCRVGVPGAKPTFLIWGDSHAAMLQPGIDERAKTLGLSGWLIGYSRCPALIGAAPLQHADGDFPCVEIAEKVMSLIRDRHIRHVMLVSRWDSYISGWERGGVETRQDLTVSYTEGGVEYTGEAAVRFSLQETIRRLQILDADIWLLEQVPPQLIDVPSALAKAVYLGRDPMRLQRPYAEMQTRRAPAEAIFDDLRRSGDVSFIDPAERFCPMRGACMIELHGRSLYQDNNHLTVFAARWSRDMFDPFFSATLQ